MAVAEIITIGTELLLGEIQDTNSKYIARVLRDIGVDLYRISTVGDNLNRISVSIQEALTRADIVITTGGLGPTVDDPTRQAVADAVGVELEYIPELWDTVIERFKRYGRQPTENNKRQAFVPAGAIVINNPVGTASAFACEKNGNTIISLPGVPREMEYLIQNNVLDYLKSRYGLEDTIIKATVLHTVSMGESSIDEVICDLETLSNPTVGLLAHPGQTDIRVTAKAASIQAADEMIAPVVKELFKMLGDVIYGVDGETLESVVAKQLNANDLHLAIIESGLDGNILRRFSSIIPDKISGEDIAVQLSIETIKTLINEYKDQETVDIILGARLTLGENKHDLYLLLLYKGEFFEQIRSYGGPSGDAPLWAVNSSLDFIRRNLMNI
ncbi:MAG: molybdopterin-binding protein [Chloroflexota bacterium]